ncbi:hypothetical protein LQV05_001739 [Cryptococcus neoformans]|nr:hypothetical protein LQV05_001739 [Cryptococcus neoformans]
MWYATLIQWNDEAKKACFYKGLKDDIKDELARLPKAKSFKNLQDMAIRIDSHRYEQVLANTPIRSTTTNPTFNKEVTPTVNLKAAFVPSSARITRRRHLTPEEYQRHKDHNLCLYCADKNHQVAKCPVVPSQQSNAILPPKN